MKASSNLISFNKDIVSWWSCSVSPQNPDMKSLDNDISKRQWGTRKKKRKRKEKRIKKEQQQKQKEQIKRKTKRTTQNPVMKSLDNDISKKRVRKALTEERLNKERRKLKENR